MSHAANLRKYHPPHTNLPTKRRRLSPSSSSSTALSRPNGVPDLTATKLSAVPTHDLKAREKIHSDRSKVNVREAEPINDLATSSESSSSDDDEEDESTDSDSSDDEDDDASEQSGQEVAQNSEKTQLKPDRGGKSGQQKSTYVQDEHATGDADESDVDGEPTFGDLLRARAPETITVDATAADPADAGSSLAGPPTKRALSVPSANSLGTVLTQALKTNDADLLESCLHTPNLESIRATIERIHPAQATALLQRLAERLHRRPGRAGSLMVWVQWTVVAHGGYLASQPAAMKELRTLYRVVKQRASGLQPLLALKGKLDMLEAQMQLRRNIQARSKAARRDEEEEGIIYVEGQEYEIDQIGDVRTGKDLERRQGKGKATLKPSLTLPSDDESDGEGMQIALPNGVDGSDAEDDEGEDDAEYDSDGDEEDDDEVEDSEGGSDELSDETDYDDVDGRDDTGSESDDEDHDEPPSKRPRNMDTSSRHR